MEFFKLDSPDPSVEALNFFNIDDTVENISEDPNIGLYPDAVLASASVGTNIAQLFGFTPVIFEDLDIEIFNSTSPEQPDSFLITKSTTEIPNFPFAGEEFQIQLIFEDENQFDSTELPVVLDEILDVVADSPRNLGDEIQVFLTESSEAEFPEGEPAVFASSDPFLIIADFNFLNNDEQIYTYDEEGNITGFFRGIPQDTRFQPNAPLVGPDNLVYVSDQAGNRIVRFDLAGNFLGTFGEANTEDSGLLYPSTTSFGPDGNLYVNSGATSQILQFEGETGEFLGVFASRDNGFPDNIVDPFPPPPDFTELDFGPDGDLYLSVFYEDGDGNPENGTGTIRRYAGPNSDEPGMLKRTYNLNILPTRVEFGPDGNIYLNDSVSNLGDGNLTSIIHTFDPESEASGEELLEVFVDGFATNILDNYEGEIIDPVILAMKFNRDDGNLYVAAGGQDPELLTPGGQLAFVNVSQIHVYAGPNSENPGEFLRLVGDTILGDEAEALISGNFTGPSFSNNSAFTPEPEPISVFGTTENDVLEAGLDFSTSNSLIFAGEGDDLIDLTQSEGGNRAYGGSGNDTFILGTGDRLVGDEGADRFFARVGGDNLITGGAGADEFWIATGEIPDAANSITDFNFEEDVIGVAGLGISSADELTFTQVESDTAIAFEGSDLAIILDAQASELQASASFAFG